MNQIPAAGGVGVRDAAELCALIDELGPQATGEVAVRRDGHAGGSVFVEQGRVCWAAAQGLARRLTELLEARAALPRGQMESFFVTCRKQNVPLGEHLVGRGVLAARDLREALLQHTAESLASLCGAPAKAAWSPQSGKGYSPRFTFNTAELFARIGATAHAQTALMLAPLLEATFAETDWAAGFVRASARALPEAVAVYGSVPPAAMTLVRVGRWAISSLDVAAAFSGDEGFLSMGRSGASGPRALVAFRFGDAVVAGETGEHGPARILNWRAQARRMGGGRGDV